MNNALCCTNCGDVVLKSVNGTIKIRSKVLVFDGSQALAVCKGCDTEIPVPLRFDESMVKSVAETKKLRLYVTTHQKKY